ncbi:MAG TPA: hypothetical protein VF974_00650 [Patescibacteria group bacterium]
MATSNLPAGLSAKGISQIIANKQKINPEQSFAEVTRRQIEVINSKSYSIIDQCQSDLLEMKGRMKNLDGAKYVKIR